MGFLLDSGSQEGVLLPDGRAMTVRTLPAIATMATMVSIGIANHIGCYGRLGTWMEYHQFHLAGPGREVFIEPFQPAREDEAVIEIQLPVTRNGNEMDSGYALVAQ
jgi:effector-binding domain-containing protein